MPLDQVQSYDYFYDRLLGTELKFAWLPELCHISGKRIWLTYGYRITAMWSGPGESIFEHKWHDKNTHIMWLLKR